MGNSPCEVWQANWTQNTLTHKTPTPSKNKPLKIINLCCILTAQGLVQESMKVPVHWSARIWWYIWLTSPAKATGSFLNLTKTSTYNITLWFTVQARSVLLSWAVKNNPNFGCGLLWSYHREMWKEPFWWWFWLIHWDFSDISFT